jgi:choline dehydrogenase
MGEGTEQFDYIVVGAGAAGCVVAARLSEDPSVRVLLLEEGPHDKSIYIRANGGYFKTHGTKRTFLFHTEPELGAAGRPFPLLQGRTLGGGTSVNSMVYIRGQPQDYDDWVAAGCKGWSYEDVLPYFRKAENNSRLAGRFHGTEGPLRVSDGVHRHVLTEAFVRAAQEVQQPPKNTPIAFNHDFNGEHQEGVGFYQTMSYRGERSSTSRSFLAQALKRGNISVRPDSLVRRVIFEGRRASGVGVRRGDGTERIFRATREVILSAGSFMSPKILMLSGVGPAATLKHHGVPVVYNSPNVGANYQDHFLVPVDVNLSAPIGLNGQDRGLKALINGIQWLMFRTGPLASNVVEAGGFFDLDGDGRPDIQLNALAVSSAGWGDPVPREHRFSLAPLCLTCYSRGTVTLRSTDPADKPIVRGNFLHERDVENLTNGIVLSRRIIAAPSLSRYMADEALPGPKVGNSKAEISRYVLSMAKTSLHPTSTCAMGPGPDSVVDLRLKVRGVGGLRVVDASVMPMVIRGNTAAPIIMIAERASDLIRGDA